MERFTVQGRTAVDHGRFRRACLERIRELPRGIGGKDSGGAGKY